MSSDAAYFIHNPRCSKSREALALIQDKNLDIEVIEYLKHPFSYEQLVSISKALNTDVKAMLRSKEEKFKAQNLKLDALSDEEILRLIAAHPKLLERPILVVNNQARIGRPPESIMELLD